MLWDTHMHTHHSGDSDALMPDMIQAAVRQNLDGICFTDHFDYDYPDDPDLFLLDFDSYIKEVRSFQDTCHDRLSIRLGIEVGLQPHITEINRKAVTGHPFDFVIGSSHGLDDRVKKAAQARISMGRITLPHQLARLVLTEQLYRACTINAGMKYHK